MPQRGEFPCQVKRRRASSRPWGPEPREGRALVQATPPAAVPPTLAATQPARGLAVPLAGLAVLLLRALAVVALLAPLLLAVGWLLR